MRVKVLIEEELEYLKGKILEMSGGSVGQQLRINQILCREIADQKLELGIKDGLFSERLDVMIGAFVDELQHLTPLLESWMQDQKDRLRQEIKEKVGI